MWPQLSSETIVAREPLFFGVNTRLPVCRAAWGMEPDPNRGAAAVRSGEGQGAGVGRRVGSMFDTPSGRRQPPPPAPTGYNSFLYKDLRITVIIPCLNEEQGIEKVLRLMPAFVDDVIVVDNGSTDRTPTSLSRSEPMLSGKMSAVMVGLINAVFRKPPGISSSLWTATTAIRRTRFRIYWRPSSIYRWIF